MGEVRLLFVAWKSLSRPSKTNASRRADAEAMRVGMAGIHQVNPLRRDDGAGNGKQHRAALLAPPRPQRTRGCGCRLRMPIARKFVLRELQALCCVECKRNVAVLLQQRGIADVYQHFERRQRPRCGGVHHRDATFIPAPGMARGTFTIERSLREALGDNAPGGEYHENTPCSRRPSVSSTSRAPSSVEACSSGAVLCSEGSAASIQRRASTSLPRTSTARSNNAATR